MILTPDERQVAMSCWAGIVAFGGSFSHWQFLEIDHHWRFRTDFLRARFRASLAIARHTCPCRRRHPDCDWGSGSRTVAGADEASPQRDFCEGVLTYYPIHHSAANEERQRT
jgi:hypothetical protein